MRYAAARQTPNKLEDSKYFSIMNMFTKKVTKSYFKIDVFNEPKKGGLGDFCAVILVIYQDTKARGHNGSKW